MLPLSIATTCTSGRLDQWKKPVGVFREGGQLLREAARSN